VKLAAVPAPVFMTLRAGPLPTPAESPMLELAELDWPRMKLPPVAAIAVPPKATNSASVATTLAYVIRARRKSQHVDLPRSGNDEVLQHPTPRRTRRSH
jgi:hypothetical protein